MSLAEARQGLDILADAAFHLRHLSTGAVATFDPELGRSLPASLDFVSKVVKLTLTKGVLVPVAVAGIAFDPEEMSVK